MSISPPAPNPFARRLQNPGATSSMYFFSFFSFLDLRNLGDSGVGKDTEEEEVMEEAEEKLFEVEREEKEMEGGR